MSDFPMATLEDCSQFRQTLLSRPPVVVHATLLLLLTGVAWGVLWAACTRAELVVRAPGRVRPMTKTNRTADAASEESRVASLREGRVSALYVHEGKRVHEGDALLMLDDRELVNAIAKQQRTLESLQSELAKTEEMKRLATLRYQTARAKAEAELTQAEQNVARAERRRDTESRLAAVRLSQAEDAYQRVVRLQASKAVSAEEVAKAEARRAEAQLEMEQAEAIVDTGMIPVLRRTLELVEREWTVEDNELDAKRALKQLEWDAAEIELGSLTLQRDQTRLLAPSDGVVTSVAVRVGDVLEAGKTAMKIVDQEGFRLDLEVANDDVGAVRVGMPVRVKLDAYDFQRYGTIQGRVVFIAPDTAAADEATEKSGEPAASRYLVRVALVDDQIGRGVHRGRLKLGMTAQAEIATSTERLITLLLRSLRRSISLG